MSPHLQSRVVYLRKLLDQSPLSRNQIASISGLSNPYILDLERGGIANVGRDKLIALGIALNLELPQIDEMMIRFDRAPLGIDDIPLFVKASERIRISSALHPMHDSFTFDLILLAIEQHPGRHTIVSPRPASCLRAEGHRRYAEKRLTQEHVLYGDLVETILKARKHSLLINLTRYPVEQYVCRECLTDYVSRCSDPRERDWRIRHIRSAINLVEAHDSYRLHLTTECPSFIFVLKSLPGSAKRSHTLVIANTPPHRYQVKTTGMLAGFATENPAVVENFTQELRVIQNTVIDTYESRSTLVAYLENLVRVGKP